MGVIAAMFCIHIAVFAAMVVLVRQIEVGADALRET
jgi:hypothetical protein